jgi:Tfp pilus assembly protein PilF
MDRQAWQRRLPLEFGDASESMATIPEALAIAIECEKAERLGEAEVILRQILAIAPGTAVAHHHLGNVLSGQERLDEAAIAYRNAFIAFQNDLALNPLLPEVHNNLGVMLLDQGKYDEAANWFRQALQLRPSYALAHNNLGLTLHELGRFDEAVESYRMALEHRPDYADAHWHQSLTLLLRGNFQQGWSEYEWRWKLDRIPARDFASPQWSGQALNRGTILLHVEQGLGDTIQFIRYAPIVKNFIGTVLVECPKALMPLLTGCPGIDRLIEQGEQLPPFDVQASLLSLPGLLHTNLGTIPGKVPYLFADPELVVQWREKLAGLGGFRIGIAWHGQPGHGTHRGRDIPLDCFAALGQLPGAFLISLQKGAGQEKLTHAGERLPIFCLEDSVDTVNGAFMDTAAVMMNLDLVITSDTSVAHLAGALGVPVWLALPFVPDWRWLLDRSDSPWYPTMRLFRQKKPGDWAGVFEEMEGALRSTIAEL